MEVNKSFKDKVVDKVLSYIPDNRIRVESALRSEKKEGGKSASLKVSPKVFEAKSLKDWKDAVALATDTESPDFLFLDELYDNLLLDSHTVSVIETRIHRVLRSKFKLINSSGEEIAEAKELFEKPWFEQFLKHAMMSLFTGVQVIELFDLGDDLELVKATLIPMAHTNTKKGLILVEPGNLQGAIPYKEGNNQRFFLQIGENQNLGMLSDLATMIIAKKMAKGYWLDYIEKYGVPPRWITTDNMSPDREEKLLQVGLDMISNHVAVLQGGEKIEMANVPTTDAYKVFHEFIKLANSEISKRVLGQDGTTDNKDASGTYGSLKILSEVADDRHESDKLFAQYIINQMLIPKLIGLSSAYSKLNGLVFDWDNSEDLSNNEYIDRAISLIDAGFELDHKVIAERSGMPITGFIKKSPKNVSQEETNTKKKSQ